MRDDNGRSASHAFIEKRLTQLYKIVQLTLWAKGCVVPREHTEDVAQDVCERLIEKWDALRSPDDAFYAVATNRAKEHARKCRREVPEEIADDATPCWASPALEPEEVYANAILVRELLAILNPSEREIVALRFQDIPYEVIGELLGMPSSTARSIYSRALGRLRRTNTQVTEPQEQIPVATD